MATTCQVVSTDVFLRAGDSTDATGFAYQVQNGLFRIIDDHFMRLGALSSPLSYRRPHAIREAVSGSVVADVDTRLTTELPINPGITAAAFSLLVNDVHLGTPLATVSGHVTSICSKLNTAGIFKGWWLGPYAWGEDGGFRTACLNVDATVAPIITASGLVYISLVALYDRIKAQFNPTNLVSGPGTRPDSSGVHFNGYGQSQITRWARPYLSFA